MTNKKVILGGLSLLILLAVQPVSAQSTLFNIPSTDAVAMGKAYAEFDYLAQMPSSGSRLYAYVPRIVVGVGGNVEAGVNVAAFRAGGSTQSFFQPNIKWRFAANDDKGVAASVGTILYTPMNNRDSVDTYGVVYGNVSKKVKSDLGPRFTIGPYAVYSADGWSGAKGGVIAGYEQPLASKVTFLADWISGENGLGYLTPGFSFTLPHASLLNVGYSIGNTGYHNKLLFIYYGITFP